MCTRVLNALIINEHFCHHHHLLHPFATVHIMCNCVAISWECNNIRACIWSDMSAACINVWQRGNDFYITWTRYATTDSLKFSVCFPRCNRNSSGRIIQMIYYDKEEIVFEERHRELSYQQISPHKYEKNSRTDWNLQPASSKINIKIFIKRNLALGICRARYNWLKRRWKSHFQAKISNFRSIIHAAAAADAVSL